MNRSYPKTSMRVAVGRLAFDIAISGPLRGRPVLLLHGFPQTASCWDPITPLLHNAGLRTIAPDQRGYSELARPSGVDQYAMPHLVSDAMGLLDSLRLRAVDVVGHDWGAVVAWHLAAWHPERVRTLTAVSAPHPAAYGWALRNDEDQRHRSRYIDLFRQEGKAERVLLEDGARRLRGMFAGEIASAQVEEHVGVLSQPGALAGALAWYRAMTRDMDELTPITVPTTYVWSTGDPAFGRASAERCGEHVQGPYRFVVLDGVHHWIPEEAPSELASAVVDGLKLGHG